MPTGTSAAARNAGDAVAIALPPIHGEANPTKTTAPPTAAAASATKPHARARIASADPEQREHAGHGDEHVRHGEMARGVAEVAGRPDPEDLELAQRARQVSELGVARERAGVVKPLRGGVERGDGEHRGDRRGARRA